jgi:hypothetical protein
MLMLCNDCLQPECICNIKYDKLTICVICGTLFEAHSEVARAKRKNLPVSLSLVQWLNTIADFRGCCAWCQKTGYSHIEMFVLEKGLVWENVAPSCRSCSHHRRAGFEQAEQRVREYLSANTGREEDMANLEYFYEEE